MITTALPQPHICIYNVVMMIVLEFHLLKSVFIRLYVQLTSHSFSSPAASDAIFNHNLKILMIFWTITTSNLVSAWIDYFTIAIYCLIVIFNKLKFVNMSRLSFVKTMVLSTQFAQTESYRDRNFYYLFIDLILCIVIRNLKKINL